MAAGDLHELRWRGGVTRQAHDGALQHQLAASHAAAEKRKSTAMPKDERQAKRNAHAREVHARKKAEREAAVAAALEAAALARVPSLEVLNEWLEEKEEELCDEDEWREFDTFILNSEEVDGLEDLDDDELERDGFLKLFFGWRESAEGEKYAEEKEEEEQEQQFMQDLADGKYEDEMHELELQERENSLPCDADDLAPSPPPPDDGDDPWGGGSADMYYDKLDDGADYMPPHSTKPVAMELKVVAGGHVTVDVYLSGYDYERECEKELCRQEYISSVTGKPWHQVPPGHVIPWSYEMGMGRDGITMTGGPKVPPPALPKDIAPPKAIRVPPPYRDEKKYGPRADNSRGDEKFRVDRASWYEDVTGESLQGLDLTEQWQRVDKIARVFRADTRDGRASAHTATAARPPDGEDFFFDPFAPRRDNGFWDDCM